MALSTPNKIRTPDAGDEYALPVDLGLMADSIEAALVYSSGTGAPSGGGSPGKLYLDLNNGITYRYTTAFGWRRITPERGYFVGATSSTGTVTVNHNLGQEPAQVFVTNRDAGAIPRQRHILPGAYNATQIQFIVARMQPISGSTGDVLPNNPVEFYWIAYPQ